MEIVRRRQFRKIVVKIIYIYIYRELQQNAAAALAITRSICVQMLYIQSVVYTQLHQTACVKTSVKACVNSNVEEYK